jgi:hypothetical protein
MQRKESTLVRDLWDRLNQPLTSPMRLKAIALHMKEAVKHGWLPLWAVQDLLADHDERLGSIDIPAIASHFQIPITLLYSRPRSYTSSVSGSLYLSTADVAALLIVCERLGFRVDPAPLVEAVMATLLKRKLLTNAELCVFWFGQERHKGEAVSLCAGERREVYLTQVAERTLKTSTGYKVSALVDTEGIPVILQVDAPKYRYRRKPVETKCTECGMIWYRGDTASSRAHRRFHRKEMALLHPAPDPRLLAALDEEASPEEVLASSPQWKHDLVWEFACRFRREFGYDFLQYGRRQRDLDAVAFLFADDTGTFGRAAPIGGCCFRLRREKHWGLQWIWLIPDVRRKGVLKRRWESFQRRFGEFNIEEPLSDAMQEFARKHATWLDLRSVLD